MPQSQQLFERIRQLAKNRFEDDLADITLSRGKVYSCTYPLSKVQDVNIIDTEAKWTLAISGEKKFDYNIVKPATAEPLNKYEASLRKHLISLSLKS